MRRSWSLLIGLALATPAAAFGRPHAAFIRVPQLKSSATLQPHAAAAAFQPYTAAVPDQLRTSKVCAQVLGEQQVDIGSIGRYVIGVLVQLIGVTTFFGVLDLVSYGPLPGDVQLGGPLPWPAVFGVFLALSVGSRVFNPLDDSQPELRGGVTAEEDDTLAEYLDAGKFKQKVLFEAAERRGLLVDNTMDKPELARRLRLYLDTKAARSGGAGEGSGTASDAASASIGWLPEWLPAGAIEWGLVGPLRAAASSVLYQASTGRLNEAHLNDATLLWLVFHLAICDTWRTVDGVEGRTGASVPGAALVWLSAAFAAKQYYDVAPLAGGLLALTLVYFTAEAASVANVWWVRNQAKAEPLYPYKRFGFRSATRLTFEPWGRQDEISEGAL